MKEDFLDYVIPPTILAFFFVGAIFESLTIGIIVGIVVFIFMCIDY